LEEGRITDGQGRLLAHGADHLSDLFRQLIIAYQVVVRLQLMHREAVATG
jgi:hypothetical protein